MMSKPHKKKANKLERSQRMFAPVCCVVFHRIPYNYIYSPIFSFTWSTLQMRVCPLMLFSNNTLILLFLRKLNTFLFTLSKVSNPRTLKINPAIRYTLLSFPTWLQNRNGTLYTATFVLSNFIFLFYKLAKVYSFKLTN
jgi:hypothetical protein